MGGTEFCCCDDDGTCDEDINASSLDSCGNGCDTFVAVLPPDCQGDDCGITTGTVTELISVSQFGYIFSFDFDGLSNEVGHFTFFAFCVLHQYIFIAKIKPNMTTIYCNHIWMQYGQKLEKNMS